LDRELEHQPSVDDVVNEYRGFVRAARQAIGPDAARSCNRLFTVIISMLQARVQTRS